VNQTPLNALINIYDDEEIPEVSLVTPIQIIEEKGPEKVSSPSPDTQIRLPQHEQVVESVLDTDQPNAPETQEDSSKDDPRLNEQKEESPRQKINIPTTDYQVSIEHTLDASISIGTHPPDEQQT